ncbi:hypothetical protein EPUL_003810 [Erysiphe pulchra]|uniref:Uncharacterized protein n=1 Tax=Erysiphe pulchra TaxID=225359 RepID=A0A2S4PNM0_9PEZI|nr:hypothetical protein EPUL_003810 [Erysiphe pulchra]
MGLIVDVVAEMKNGHFIKCKRVDEFKPEPSIIGQNYYGYECGHELFSHEVVQMSANLAQSNNGRNKLYHNPYDGPLFSPELHYSIYPLSREKNLHYAGKKPENTYFVVISPAGQIIDVIAKLKRGDFIKCARTTTAPPDDIESDDVSRPFNYYLVMDKNFQIKFAAVKTPNGIKPCEASMRGIEVALPEKDNFKCEYSNIEFKNEILLEIVDAGCKALGTQARKYPAKYNGPEFNVHGPYVTWPIRKGNSIRGCKN